MVAVRTLAWLPYGAVRIVQKLLIIVPGVLWQTCRTMLVVTRAVLFNHHMLLLAMLVCIGLYILICKLNSEDRTKVGPQGQDAANAELVVPAAAAAAARAAAVDASQLAELNVFSGGPVPTGATERPVRRTLNEAVQFAAEDGCLNPKDNSCKLNVPPIRLQALRHLLHRECPFLAASPYDTPDWQNLSIDRSTCLEDSMAVLLPSQQELKVWQAPFRVHFRGEDGVDASGLKREWVSVVARQLQSKCLSRTGNEQLEEFCVAPASAITGMSYDQLLTHYHWFGMFLGKMLLENNRAWRAPLQLQLPFQLTPLFYKLLMGGEPDFNDIKRFDPLNYRGIFQTLVNAEAGTVDALCLTFVYYRRSRGNTPRPQPLKPGGGKVAVTDSNKEEYMSLYLQEVKRGIMEQMDRVIEGKLNPSGCRQVRQWSLEK